MPVHFLAGSKNYRTELHHEPNKGKQRLGIVTQVIYWTLISAMAALAAYVSYVRYFILLTFQFSLLPLPTNAPTDFDDEEEVQVPQSAHSQSLITRTPIPPYGQRIGWKPLNPEDFGMCVCSISIIRSVLSLSR